MTIAEAIKLLTETPSADALAAVEAHYDAIDLLGRGCIKGQDLIACTKLSALMREIGCDLRAKTPPTPEQIQEMDAIIDLFRV